MPLCLLRKLRPQSGGGVSLIAVPYVVIVKTSSLREGQQIPHLPEELRNDQHASYVIGHVGYPAH